MTMATLRKRADADTVVARTTRIRETTIFAGLNDKAYAELAAIAHFRALRKGTVLWKQGSHAYELAFVWEGALGVVRSKGDERVGYRIVAMNETIGFSNAMGRVPCSVDVVAHETTRVLLFPGDTLRGLVPSHPEIAFRAIAYLGVSSSPASPTRSSISTTTPSRSASSRACAGTRRAAARSRSLTLSSRRKSRHVARPSRACSPRLKSAAW